MAVQPPPAPPPASNPFWWAPALGIAAIGAGLMVASMVTGRDEQLVIPAGLATLGAVSGWVTGKQSPQP